MTSGTFMKTKENEKTCYYKI